MLLAAASAVISTTVVHATQAPLCSGSWSRRRCDAQVTTGCKELALLAVKDSSSCTACPAGAVKLHSHTQSVAHGSAAHCGDWHYNRHSHKVHTCGLSQSTRADDAIARWINVPPLLGCLSQRPLLAHCDITSTIGKLIVLQFQTGLPVSSHHPCDHSQHAPPRW